MHQKDRIRTGIVFSGGIAKGAYQIGFCRAFMEYPSFQLSAVSAASVGTLNGYALSSGKLSLAEKLWRNINTKSFREIYDKVFRHSLVFELIEKICSESDHLNVPFYSVFWVPNSLRPKYIQFNQLDRKSRLDFLKASISLPPVMKPVEIDGVKFYDGAIVDNTPLNPLFPHQLDFIISIQFDGYIPAQEQQGSSCPILFLNLQNYTGFYDSFHLAQNEVEAMMEYGYTAGSRVLSRLEQNFREYGTFSHLIADYNSTLKENPVSGDYIFRRVNRLSKRL